MNKAKPLLTLKQFMLRSEVLRTYRQLMRTVNQIPNVHERSEMKEWIRGDFRANKHQTDEVTIKTLIAYAKRSHNELKTTLQLAK